MGSWVDVLPSGGLAKLEILGSNSILRKGTSQRQIARPLLRPEEHPRSSDALVAPASTQRETKSVSERIIHVTDDSFEQEVLKSSDPVLVDYWADWCGPCKMIAPVLDEIAEEYTGKIKVAKLNIDENPNTPPRYGIRGIPTLMLFKEGEVEATKVGAVSKSQLTAFIDSNL
jgi:thioredoxin 1